MSNHAELNGTAVASNKGEKLKGLTELERDLLTLTTAQILEKWPQLIKNQHVFDRKYTLSNRLKKQGLTPEKAISKLPEIPLEQGFTKFPKEYTVSIQGETPPTQHPKKENTTKVVLPPVPEPEAFEVEHNPPPPMRGNQAEALEFIAKLEKTLPNWIVGGAIVVDAKKKNTALNYLKENYQHDKWSIAKIYNNPDKVRIYRLKL